MGNIRVAKDEELPVCVDVIRRAFGTVAQEFNLTRENAPTNTAFIETRHLEKMRAKGIELYALEDEDGIVGFVAIEKQNDVNFMLERLAVLPEKRHKGYGRLLVDFVSQKVRAANGKQIVIGIIDENAVLKNWYEGLGFVAGEKKKFDHLPFTVCYMTLKLE